MPISGWHFFDPYSERARYAMAWLLREIDEGEIKAQDVVYYTAIDGEPEIFVNGERHVIVDGIGGAK